MKNQKHFAALSMLFMWSSLESARAVEIEPMGKALVALLGTPKSR